ncbi:MAG: phage tail length tape measure family protein [Metallibacterium scheffleri]
MAGPADEIIVRLTADSSGMSAGLQSGADQVQSASDQMAQAAQAAAAQVNEAQASMAQASGGAADAFDASTTAMQASMDALAANITAATEAAKAEIAEMVAAAGGGTAGLAVSQAVAADAAAFNAAAMARAAAAGNLSAAMAGGITSTEGLAAAESALDEAMATGAVTASEFAAIQVELGAAEDALTAQVDANTASVEANTGAKAANDAASSGQGFRFHGIYGTVAQGMNLLLSPAGMVTAALGSLALVEGVAAGKMGELNLALLSTGDAAGVTGGEMNAWSNELATSMGTVQDARNAYASLAQSGIFIGDALHTAGTAAIEWSEVTGTSSQQAASAIERMAANPTAAIKNLTAAQAQEVESLLEMGHKAEAGQVAVQALSSDLDAQKSAIQSNIPWWDKWGDAIANAAEKGGEAIKNMAGLGDLQQRIQDAKGKLHADEQGGLARWVVGGEAAHALGMGASPLQIMRDKAQLHLLESDLHTRLTDARNHAELHDARMGAVVSGAALDRLEMGAHPHAAAVQRVDELLRHVVQGNGALPAGVYQSGSAFSGPGFEELVRAAGGNALPKGEHAAHVSAATHAKNIYDSIWNAGPPSSAAGGAHVAAVHAAAEAEAVQKMAITSQASHSVAMLGMQRSHVEAMASMGTIGGASAIEQEQKIADSIYAIKLRELEKEKALAATKPEETARINSEIVRLQDTHTATMIGLSDKASAQQIKSAEAVVQPVIQTFSQITAGFVEGTLTRQQAELRLGDALVAETINTGMQMLMHHIAIDNAKTLATAEGEAKRLALHVWGEAEALAIQAATAIKWILTEAAKAAAGAFSAMAGIPIVGPALAVAAGAATFVAVEALVSNVASAQGGFERVPFDNMPAVLHKDEQVLPAQYAEGLRNLVAGGGGSTYHYHIHANDAAGFENMLRRNSGALVRAFQHAHRTGHTA